MRIKIKYTHFAHGKKAFAVLHSKLYTVKKGLALFPSSAGMSLTKLSLAGINLPNPSPRKVWSKQIQEPGKFFLRCTLAFM